MGCRPSRSSLGRVADCTSDYNRHYIKEFDKARRKQRKHSRGGGRRRTPTYNAFSSTTKYYEKGEGCGTSKITVRLSTDGSMLEIEQYDDGYDPTDNFTTDYSQTSQDYTGLEMKPLKDRRYDRLLSCGRSESAPLLKIHCVESDSPAVGKSFIPNTKGVTNTHEDNGDRSFNCDNAFEVKSERSTNIPRTLGNSAKNHNHDPLRTNNTDTHITENENSVHREFANQHETLRTLSSDCNPATDDFGESVESLEDWYTVKPSCKLTEANGAIDIERLMRSHYENPGLGICHTYGRFCNQDTQWCDTCNTRTLARNNDSDEQNHFCENSFSPVCRIPEMTTFYNFSRPQPSSVDAANSFTGFDLIGDAISRIDSETQRQVPSDSHQIDSECFVCEKDKSYGTEPLCTCINSKYSTFKPFSQKDRRIDSNANICCCKRQSLADNDANICCCKRQSLPDNDANYSCCERHSLVFNDKEIFPTAMDLEIIKCDPLLAEKQQLQNDASQRSIIEYGAQRTLDVLPNSLSSADNEYCADKLTNRNLYEYTETQRSTRENTKTIDFYGPTTYCHTSGQNTALNNEQKQLIIGENQVSSDCREKSLSVEINQVDGSWCPPRHQIDKDSKQSMCICNFAEAKHAYKLKSVSMATNDVSKTFQESAGNKRFNHFRDFITESSISINMEPIKSDFGSFSNEDVFHDARCHPNVCDVTMSYPSRISVQTGDKNENINGMMVCNETAKVGGLSLKEELHQMSINNGFGDNDVNYQYIINKKNVFLNGQDDDNLIDEVTDYSDDCGDDEYVDAMETTYV